MALALPLVILRRQRVVLRGTLQGSAAPPPRRALSKTGQSLRPYHAAQSAENKSASLSDDASPGTGELLAAISRVDFSSAMFAGKAFAIATGLVAVGGVALTLAVKTFMGVQDVRGYNCSLS